LKEQLKKIQRTVISGIVLFIPVFVLLAILEKVFGFLSGFGKGLASTLGLKSIGGVSAAPIVTTILLVIIFYLSGLLVRFALVTKAKEWIENSVLNYVPNYAKYKAKMLAKVQPTKDERKPALVEINDCLKPCLIVSSSESKTTVFVPSCPDTDNGEVLIVDSKKVKAIKMDIIEFKNSLLLSGRGLKYN
jgi:uncharacterized membrane protein